MSGRDPVRCEACGKEFPSADFYRSHRERGCCEKLQAGFFHSCSHCDARIKGFADDLFAPANGVED